MDVKKFQFAMRPKKYLTHDFLVYQDPKMQAARSEMQAGGIVQREGFDNGGRGKKLETYGGLTSTQMDTARYENVSFEIDRNNKLGISTDLSEVAKKTGYDYTQLNKMVNTGKVISPVNKEDLVIQYIKNAYDNNEVLSSFNKENIMKYINHNIPAGSKARIGEKTVKDVIRTKVKNQLPKIYNTVYNPKMGAMRNLQRISKLKDTPVLDFIEDPNAVRSEQLASTAKKGQLNAKLNILEGKLKLGKKDFEISQAMDQYVKNLNAEIKNKPALVLDNPKLMELATTTFDNNPKSATYGQLLPNTRSVDKVMSDIKKGFFSTEHLVPKATKKGNIEFPTNKVIVPRTTNARLIRQAQSFFENNPTKTTSLNEFESFVNKNGFNVRINNKTMGPKVGSTIEDGKLRSYSNSISNYGIDPNIVDNTIASLSPTEFSNVKTTMKKEVNTLTSLLKDFEKNPATMKAVIGSLSDDPACALPEKAEGGRIGFQKGSDLCYQQGLKKLDEARKNPEATAKLKGKLGKAAKGFGKVLRFLELPFEVAIEGLLVGDAMLRGQSFERAVKGNTLLMRALMPGGYSTSADEQRIKEISENNPAVKTYFDAKQRADKYQELVNKVEQNEKIASGLVAPEDVELTASNLEESKKELNEYIENNYQHFDRDKEILNPEGYHAQQADQAAREYVSKEVYESGYGKGQVAAREAQIEDPLADFIQPEQEFEKERLEDVQEQVDQFGFIPTEQEFMQGLNKDAMKQFIKNRYPKMDEQELNMLTDFAIQQQYQNIRNPYAVYDYSKSVPASPFARGGRVGFSNGGGIRRRTFLKLMAGIGVALGAIKSGIFKLSSPVAKKVLKDAPAGTPDWFAPLVDKIMKEGVDADETMKTVTGRETVKKLEVPTEGAEGALTDKYFLYENPDTGEIRIEIDIPGAGANDGEFALNMRPNKIDGISDDGTPMMDEGEFFVTEERAVGRMNGPDDFDIELETIDTDLSDSASDFYKVEEFATGKTNKKAQAEQLRKKDYIEKNPGDDIESRYGPFDDTPPDDYYD